MSKSSVEGMEVVETASALRRIERVEAGRYGVYVGLDVHKESIAVAVAECGRGEPRYEGEIAHTAKAVAKLIKRLSQRYGGEALMFFYEAGCCGYGLYRQICETGHGCEVVAPSLIPRKAGDRVKTDRRDALMLARLGRAGELTAVWVPDTEQEAIRDLTRAREDMKAIELKARQRLGAFLLRHARSYDKGKAHWTQRHFEWLRQQRFDNPIQQLVFEEYLVAVCEAQARVAGLEQQMRQALGGWSLGPVAEALMALRGVSVIAAMTLLAELGDLTRFDNPRQLMAYIGLVPSEHSSGGRRRPGGITKTGNAHARRVLVEAAWAYRFPARQTRAIAERGARTSPSVRAIAWKAQKRLCARYRHLLEAGKNTQQTITAVARELAGFLWAIACEIGDQPRSQASA